LPQLKITKREKEGLEKPVSKLNPKY
jgi:hypothetical protein